MWTFGGLQGAVWSFPRTTWTRGRTGGSYEKEQSVLHFGDIGGAHVGCADGGEVPPYQRHGMRRDALLLGGERRPRRARGVGGVRRGRVVHLVGKPQLRRGLCGHRLHVVPRGAAARRALGGVHALLPRAGQPAARLHRDGRHAVHPDRLLSRSCRHGDHRRLPAEKRLALPAARVRHGDRFWSHRPRLHQQRRPVVVELQQRRQLDVEWHQRRVEAHADSAGWLHRQVHAYDRRRAEEDDDHLQPGSGRQSYGHVHHAAQHRRIGPERRPASQREVLFVHHLAQRHAGARLQAVREARRRGHARRGDGQVLPAHRRKHAPRRAAFGNRGERDVRRRRGRPRHGDVLLPFGR